MARHRNSVPSYLPHNQSGRARAVWTDPAGIRHFRLLPGPFESTESKEAFAKLQLELAASPIAHAAAADSITVNELVLAYATWVEKNRPTTTTKRYPGGTDPRFALRSVRGLFGTTRAAEFGPKALKTLRETWVAAGLSRKVINGRVGAVRRMFRWAVGEELASPEVYQRLQAVEGLRAGQTDAPDHTPVKPAVMADIEAALPHMPEPVRALVQVQLHCAARAGELVRLRACDIDRTDPEVWTYTPSTHKSRWKGKGRVIYFGRRCREVLAPLILKAGTPAAYLFSPARNEQERNAERRENRVTPRWESHMARNARKRVGAKRRRPPGQHYTTGSYRQAIERACEKASVPAFTPHRLRHLAATRARAELGVDVARALCGHTLAAVTEIYSREVDKQLAMQAVKLFG